MKQWHALVLAGSRGAADPVAQAAGVSHKAFASLAGKPMINHVLTTLEKVDDIATLAVSIEHEAPALTPDIQRLDAKNSPANSVLSAFNENKLPLLITTADNPLLSCNTVTNFLQEAEQSMADVVGGVCLKQIVEQAGRGGRRTYLKFSDGYVSGCNLFAINTPKGINAIQFWRKLEQNRKQPWKMARELGLSTLARYFFGGLSSKAAMERLNKKASCRAALIRLDDPLAAHDVDKPEDMTFAETILRQPLRL